MWIIEMIGTSHLETIRFILNDKLKQFLKIWSPFIYFLEQQYLNTNSRLLVGLGERAYGWVDRYISPLFFLSFFLM